jgi:hypothetical protein
MHKTQWQISLRELCAISLVAALAIVVWHERQKNSQFVASTEAEIRTLQSSVRKQKYDTAQYLDAFSNSESIIREHFESVTVRCDYGNVDIISGGYLAPRTIVDLYGEESNGKFSLLLEKVRVTGAKWEFDESSVHVVDLQVPIGRTNQILKYSNHQLEFPHERHEVDE